MRRLIGCVAAASCLAAAGSIAAGPQDAERPDLDTLLGIMGRVASLYRDSALSFTCVERVTDTHYRSQDRIGSRQTYNFDYFYVFHGDEEAAASGGTARAGLNDYRTFRGDDPYAEPVRVEPAELGVSAYQTRAYSSVFVFQPGVRDLHMFIHEPDGEALGRDAYVVAFEPLLPYRPELSDWLGRVWIDKQTYQLLQVESVKSDEYLQALAQGPVEEGSRFLFAWTRVQFDEEKNGLRFPSEASLVGVVVDLPAAGEAGYRRTARRLLDRGVRMGRLFRVQQSYRDYRFFSVRTAIEVTERIRGIRQ